MLEKKIEQMVRQSIDLHVHIGPEVIPRKYTVSSLVKSERGKIGGCVLKNHFLPTANLLGDNRNGKLALYGSIVLNHYVGGLNPDAVYAAAYISPRPLFVWMPTLHTSAFLKESLWEVPPEWVKDKNFRSRPSKDIQPVVLAKDGVLVPEATKTLKAIAEVGAVLCTGHLSVEETILLVDAAQRMGVTKIIVTHPVYQKIAMPLVTQKYLASLGCLIEHCYSMYSIDNIAVEVIADQIAAVGPEHIVISSDVGQSFSLSPSEAMAAFARLLLKAGLTREELYTMYVDNPCRVVKV